MHRGDVAAFPHFFAHDMFVKELIFEHGMHHARRHFDIATVPIVRPRKKGFVNAIQHVRSEPHVRIQMFQIVHRFLIVRIPRIMHQLV